MSDTPKFSDEALLTRGFLAHGAGKTLVIACGAIAREVLALIDAGGLDHLTLTCLPAILHNTPEDIAPAVDALITSRGAEFEHVLVAYGDCGTGGALEAVCQTHGAQMINAPHCYAFFDGTERFAEREEMTAFYLTDFLARQFDAFVTKPLGLDRYPELTETYFKHYETLVYLAQTDDAALVAKAKEAAAFLGLKFEKRMTGFGDLAGFLNG